MEQARTRPSGLVPLAVGGIVLAMLLAAANSVSQYDVGIEAQSAKPPAGDMAQAVSWIAAQQQSGAVVVPGYGNVGLGTHALGKHGVDAQLAIALGIQVARTGGCWECKAKDKVVCWSRFTPKGGAHEQISMFIFGLTSHNCITAFLTDSLSYALTRMTEDGCKNPWQGGHP